MVQLNWSDEDLAQRLQQHDSEALETLISRYSREVYYFIRLVLDGIGVAQDAEDRGNAYPDRLATGAVAQRYTDRPAYPSGECPSLSAAADSCS